MANVIDETWEFYSPHGFPGFLARHAGEKYAGTFFESGGDEPGDDARARLAAQAPAMARLLLAGQWICEERGDLCRHCMKLEREGHADDCELAAVLRAAGVTP